MRNPKEKSKPAVYRTIFIWFAVLLIPLEFTAPARASDPSDTGSEAVSAIRGEDEPWEDALSREISRLNESTQADLAPKQTPVKMAKPYSSGIDISALPEWTESMDALQAAFETARDQRIYTEKRRPNFKRRSTWLYPDDGCYARAAHVANALEKLNQTPPGKIFAFGHLKLKTPFHRNGHVHWWYHAVAAYRIGRSVLVLDPSVNPSGPLELYRWLDQISNKPAATGVSACDRHAYNPLTSLCIGGSASQDGAAIRHQTRFLSLEWNRLVSLRMNPKKLLGAHPPWDFTLSEMALDMMRQTP